MLEWYKDFDEKTLEAKIETLKEQAATTQSEIIAIQIFIKDMHKKIEEAKSKG